jgi:hypothetical protein
MTVPQPFQYQGSKRALAALILRFSGGSAWRSRPRPRVRAPSRCAFPQLAARRRLNPQAGRLRYRSPMTLPQPFQYQGSKRALAPLILRYLPASMTRLPACAALWRGFQVEPFCASAAGRRGTAVPGCGFGHRPGASSTNHTGFINWRRDAAATCRRDACATSSHA